MQNPTNEELILDYLENKREDTLDELFRRFSYVAKKVVQRMSNRFFSRDILDDIYNIALEGIWIAIKSFDEKRSVSDLPLPDKFEKFLIIRAHKHVFHDFCEKQGSSSARGLLRKMKKVTNSFYVQNGFNPTEKELVDLINKEPNTAKSLSPTSANFRRIESFFKVIVSDFKFGIISTKTEESLEAKEFYQDLMHRNIFNLSCQERNLIMNLFIHDDTLENIGYKEIKTKQRIHQRRNDLFSKIEDRVKTRSSNYI